MAHAINRYKADTREMKFLLFEQFGLKEMLGKAPFADWNEETINMVIDETYRFATEVAGPHNQAGDEIGCKIVDGRVIVPEAFHGIWNQLYEAGWRSLTAPADMGGQDAPRALGAIVEELLCGPNCAFAMYPGLAYGAAELLDHNGTERQRKLFASRMFQGEWGGTMCLTEPHAGSDVGSAKTKATKNEDGTYNIRGTKIYISGGDHTMADNIIHLVLARIEGAPMGTKGLSLFIVPRVHTDDDGKLGEVNDVKVTSLEHKMGINGSATCVLEFGEEGKCIGELVGGVEHKGMKQMFLMMNFARIAVGIQGAALSGSAYLNALEYAKDRKQGSSIKEFKNPEAPRVPIIEHPNVRRDLLDMKAKSEGLRALIVKLSFHADKVHALKGKDDEGADYHQGQVDLLTPLVKAYGSDVGFQVCSKAVEIYGGAGYLKDWPIEQYLRDAKILSIYEGTTAIQSLDLVGRKIGSANGKHAKNFLGDVAKFTSEYVEHPVLGEAAKRLAKASDAVGGGMMQYMQWFGAGEMERIPLTSENFLFMMSELAVGWLLLEGSAIAQKALDGGAEGTEKAFYEGKKYAGIHYALNVLPDVIARAKIMQAGDRSAVEIPENAFSSVV